MLIPPIGLMLSGIVWHARRRVGALHVAQEQAEERRLLLERQQRFIQDTAHDLRTPLTIAIGHLRLARAGGGQDGEIDIVLDELARMSAMIERLLVLAAADRPDFLCFEKIDLEPFLEDVFFRWSEVAPRAWRLGPLVSAQLLADRDRLRTALDALLENAVKYTREGAAIELRVRVDELGQALIEVEDEGCGIPDVARDQIFDRFGRGDTSRTPSAGGVGLGLAIADAIARRHGGNCRVENTPDGSVFALALPGTLVLSNESSDKVAVVRQRRGVASRLAKVAPRR